MLFGEGIAIDPTQLIGYSIITALAILINQAFSMYREYRKDNLAEAAAKIQSRRDDVAIRKDELAVCAAEDDHVQAGYEKLLERTNQRLGHVEKELGDVYVKLRHCETEHARTDERAKHFEQRMTASEQRVQLLETKYMALKKKLPGIDSDTILAPDEKR